mgnify:CR=1 FL=1
MEKILGNRVKRAVLAVAAGSMLGLSSNLDAGDISKIRKIGFERTERQSVFHKKPETDSKRKAENKRVNLGELFKKKPLQERTKKNWIKQPKIEAETVKRMTPAEKMDAVRSALNKADGKIITSEKFTHPAAGVQIVEETEATKKAAIQAKFDAAMRSGGSDLSGDPCPNRVIGYEKQLKEIENPVQNIAAKNAEKEKGRWITVIENGERKQMWLQKSEDRKYSLGRNQPQEKKTFPKPVERDSELQKLLKERAEALKKAVDEAAKKRDVVIKDKTKTPEETMQAIREYRETKSKLYQEYRKAHPEVSNPKRYGKNAPSILTETAGSKNNLASQIRSAADKAKNVYRVSSAADLGLENAGSKAIIKIGKNGKGIPETELMIREYLPDQLIIKNKGGNVHINKPIGNMKGAYAEHLTVEGYKTGDLRRNYKLFEMETAAAKSEAKASKTTKGVWSGAHMFEEGAMGVFVGALVGDEVGRRVGNGNKTVIVAGMVGGGAGALGGMYGGALLGTQVGLLCGPAAVPCMMATSVVGAAVGTVVGAEAMARITEKAREPVSNSFKEAKSDIKNAGTAVKEKTKAVTETVKKKTKKAKEKVRETAERVSERVEQTVEKVKDKVENAVDKVKETAKNTWETVKGWFD